MIDDVVYACFVAAGLCIAYAFVALRADLRAQRAVERTAETVGEAVRRTAEAPAATGLGGTTRPQALVGADRLVAALARLGEAMARLRPGAAALLLAFGLLVFSGVMAGVGDKVPDKRRPAATQPARRGTRTVPVRRPRGNGGTVAGGNGGAISR